jgi:LacI family transcriptional regulator
VARYADISAQSGYEATRELLQRGGKFTSLFAGNDTIAFGAIKALSEAGLRIPDERSRGWASTDCHLPPSPRPR